MENPGKLIFVLGLALSGVGLLVWSGFGRGWLGRLPGDINVQREGFSFHFPVVTCLLASAALSLLLWLWRK